MPGLRVKMKERDGDGDAHAKMEAGVEAKGEQTAVMLFSFPSAPQYCDSLTSRRNSFQ